ncbi:putative phage-like protein YoqJ [Alkalihalobacillus xiaoxiensis]|uniref:Phage-like protein YoqJ n=1 Tax=Shouchella xiaoxiensis TaxID=766895 RepID=A0ABS2SZI4_9BACI|nr:hypothetical protein [Shouchella xiaoxiensis]MBM7840936.1 putative phage-like protein YoqJ [Shouchella xiaoxiensis]
MKIGITGHQDLSEVPSINKLKALLKLLIEREGGNLAYTSLAIGADQIFADVCTELSIDYCAIIPAEDYIKNFDKKEKSNYKRLLNGATNIHLMPFKKSTEEAFYRAGLYISDCSDCIVAIWDGEEAKGLGGTGDIVKYSVDKGIKVIHVHPSTLSVTYL